MMSLVARVDVLQNAEKKHSVLVVLQALDAGGKDGTVNHVLSVLNPQGATAVGFKQPTSQELGHDFLWRVHPHAPGKGEIAIFNRSHYAGYSRPQADRKADLGGALPPHSPLRGPAGENGNHILKFFLHISEQEQLARFAERLDDPARNWKISESDYAERALWDDYILAFQDAIAATSTKGCALVRDLRQPQVVSQSGCVADHR
jgi:polyphosphate kinase 2 (PPK2 family)